MNRSKFLPRRKFSSLPLWLELTLALLLKLTILYSLWQAFFSHPETKHMAMPVPLVEQHLLYTPSGASATSVSSTAALSSTPSHPEVSHGSH